MRRSKNFDKHPISKHDCIGCTKAILRIEQGLLWNHFKTNGIIHIHI